MHFIFKKLRQGDNKMNTKNIFDHKEFKGRFKGFIFIYFIFFFYYLLLSRAEH